MLREARPTAGGNGHVLRSSFRIIKNISGSVTHINAALSFIQSEMLCGITLQANEMLTRKGGSFAEDKIHKSKVCLYI